MGLLDSIKGLLGGQQENPKLDKTRGALNTLKASVEKMKENQTLNDAAWKKLKNAFYEDCDELNMDEAKKEELWPTVMRKIEDDILRNTPERRNLDGFIGKMENLPVLKEAIDGKKPGALQGLRARIDAAGKTLGIDSEGMNGLILGLISIFGWNTTRGFGKWVADHLLSKPNPAPVAGSTTTPPPAPTGSPTSGAETPDPAKRKKYAELFKGQNLTLDENNVEADIKKLSENRIKEEDIENQLKTAMASGGYLKELKDVIDKATDNKPFKFRLADLLFQKKTKEEIDKIKAAIQNTDNTLPKTPEGIIKFLDELHNNSNADEVIAKYNKPPTAPTTPQQTAPATPPPAAPTNPPPATAPAVPTAPVAPAVPTAPVATTAQPTQQPPPPAASTATTTGK